MAFRSASTGVTGTGTSAAVPVPSGVQVDDIVVIGMYVETADASLTWPSGFTQFRDTGTSNATTRGRLLTAWKRLTAADAGTYSVSWTTSAVYTGQAMAFSGVDRYGDPIETHNSAATTNSGDVTGNVSITTVRRCDIVEWGTNHASNAGTYTAPTGYTKRTDDSSTGLAHIAGFTLDYQAPGTYNPEFTLSGTTGGAFWRACTFALITDRVRRISTATTGTGTSVTLPTHESGARIIVTVGLKPDTAGAPSLDQGFTLVGSGTGGGGTFGTDTGPMASYVFAKDATSGSETNPTITLGSSSDSHTWVASAYMPAKGKAWADSIGASAPWVRFAGDSDSSTSTITATHSAFGVDPADGDAILSVLAIPTDIGTGMGTPTLSLTGLSPGFITNLTYVESGTNTDSAQAMADWVDFAGPGSSGLTVTQSIGNYSGGVGLFTAILLRQGVATESLTIAAPVNQPVADFDLSGFNASNLSITAQVNQPTADFDLTGFNDSDLAIVAQVNQPVADFDFTVAPLETQLAIAAQVNQPTADFDLSGFNDSDLTIAGQVNQPTADFDLDVAPTSDALEVAAQVNQPTAAFEFDVEVIYSGDTSNRDDGLDIDGTALVEWIPAVVPTPLRYSPGVSILARDTAKAMTLTGFGPTGQPLTVEAKADAARPRYLVRIGGKDFSYFRGVKTPAPDFRLIKPLLWGSGTLTLPQVNPSWEVVGVNATDPDLARIVRDAKVELLLVDQDDEIIEADSYVGFIDAIDISGSALSLSLAGWGMGSAAAIEYVPNPIFKRRHDLAFQALGFLRFCGLRTTRGTTIGVPMFDRGGTDGVAHINELSRFMVNADGDQWDIMPVNGRVFGVVPTDRETIDFTVYLDSSVATWTGSQAFAEETDEVYAISRTRDGELIMFVDNPGLEQGPPPPYPGSPLSFGDMSDDVILLNDQLSVSNFLKYDDLANPAFFDLDTQQAVEELQDEAGLNVTGIVNEPTWNALWNLQLTGGFSTDRTRERPAAQKRWVPKWNRSANGGKLSRNRHHDPHRRRRSRRIEMGTTINRRRTKRMAKGELTPDGVSNWQGTLALKSGVIAGEHTPGDPITSADVMSARSIKPGMNCWMPSFDGGTLFHVSMVEVSNDGADVTLTLDTQARDSLKVWEVIQRDRESRSNVARAESGRRASSVVNDVMLEWTDVMGRLPYKVPLVGGEWTHVEVSAGQEGVVQWIEMHLQSPDEFAVILSQKELNEGRLNRDIPAPLTDPRPGGRPWYESDAIVARLERRGILKAWGTEQQPCGYGRAPKTDDLGPTAAEIVGWFKEQAGFNYSATAARLHLYVWTWDDNYLQRGQILKQQPAGVGF